MRLKGTRASSTSPRRTRARSSSKFGPKAFSSACNRHPVKPPSRTSGPAPATHGEPSARDGCAGELRAYAERLLAYDNLPRKKAKFVNFAKNSLNLKADHQGIAEKLWLLIEEPKAEPPKAEPPTAEAPVAAAVPAVAAAASAVSRPAEPAASAAAASKKRKTGEVEAEAEAKAEAKKAKKAAKEDAKPERKEKNEAEEKTGGGAKAAAGGAEPTAKRSERPTDGANKGVVAVSAKPAAAANTKPVKWKKIIAKELETEGGSMRLKELRSACVKEAKAHPSHKGRDGKSLGEDFDTHFGTFTGISGKFVLDGKRVRLAPERG